MEVVNQGKSPEEITWLGTCRCCASVVRAAPSELAFASEYRGERIVSAACPVCARVMYFAPEKK